MIFVLVIEKLQLEMTVASTLPADHVSLLAILHVRMMHRKQLKLAVTVAITMACASNSAVRADKIANGERAFSSAI